MIDLPDLLSHRVTVGLFDHDLASAAIRVPDGYELVTLVLLGYPAKVVSAPKCRESNVFTHHDHF